MTATMPDAELAVERLFDLIGDQQAQPDAGGDDHGPLKDAPEGRNDGAQVGHECAEVDGKHVKVVLLSSAMSLESPDENSQGSNPNGRNKEGEHHQCARGIHHPTVHFKTGCQEMRKLHGEFDHWVSFS